MKIRRKILALTLGTTFVLPMAFAQNPPPQINVSNTVVPTVSTSPIMQNTIKDPGTGNKFEKEVTPLLRDISKKRSQLEIRKLDRALELLDEEAANAKAQAQAKNNLNPNSNYVPIPSPQNGLNQMQTNSMSELTNASNNNVRVLMIYGNTNNLYAKISLGEQGGYPVRKGDILPDGRIVSNITVNYIEVSELGKKRSKPEIIPVRGQYIPTEGARVPQMSSIPTSLPNMIRK